MATNSQPYLLRIRSDAPCLAELLDCRRKHVGMTKTDAVKTQLFNLNKYKYESRSGRFRHSCMLLAGIHEKTDRACAAETCRSKALRHASARRRPARV